MPRIELWMTIFAGLAGGLAGVLWGGLVTTPWLARRGADGPAASQGESAARLLAGAALRAVTGGLLGFLFWLGWGLIALVGQPWYAIGGAVRRTVLVGDRAPGARHAAAARPRAGSAPRRACDRVVVHVCRDRAAVRPRMAPLRLKWPGPGVPLAQCAAARGSGQRSRNSARSARRRRSRCRTGRRCGSRGPRAATRAAARPRDPSCPRTRPSRAAPARTAAAAASARPRRSWPRRPAATTPLRRRAARRRDPRRAARAVQSCRGNVARVATRRRGASRPHAPWPARAARCTPRARGRRTPARRPAPSDAPARDAPVRARRRPASRSDSRARPPAAGAACRAGRRPQPRSRHFRRRLRRIRLTVARQVRRVDAAVPAEVGEQRVEHPARQRARMDADERRALVEPAAGGKRGVQVQLPVAAVHVHLAEVNGHGRRLPAGESGVARGAAARGSCHGAWTSVSVVRQVRRILRNGSVGHVDSALTNAAIELT